MVYCGDECTCFGSKVFFQPNLEQKEAKINILFCLCTFTSPGKCCILYPFAYLCGLAKSTCYWRCAYQLHLEHCMYIDSLKIV